MNHRQLYGLVIIIELIIVAAVAYSHGGFTLSALQTITRFSGRFSLFIFSIIFIFRHKPLQLDVYLLTKPFHVFALAHAIHLAELLWYVNAAGLSLNPLRTAGGILAYLLTFSMPFAISAFDHGRLKKSTFQIMETISLYYIWVVFFMTYLPRVRGTMPNAGGNYWEHVALLGWVSLMLGMKLIGLLKFKPRTSP